MSGREAASGSAADTARAVTARLARLDADDGAALVADIWAARGYDVDREGRRLRAARDGDSVTIGVVAPPRFGQPAVPEPAPDVVAVLGDADGLAADGVRVLDAADLAELLLYAVDRPAGRDLCERHLGAAPAALRLPRSAALRRRLGALPTPATVARSGLRLGGVALAAVAVAVLLAALGGSAPAGTATPGPGIDAAASGDVGEAPAAVSTAEFPETYPPGTADVLPPGVTQSGLDEPVALGRAHREQLSGLSYALTLTERSLGNATGAPSIDRYLFGSLPQRGASHTTEFLVGGESYRSTATLHAGGERTRASVYFDGDRWYVATPLYGNTSYRTTPVAGSVGPVPEELTGTLVERYLTTPETALAGVIERDGTRLYRLTANGTPDPFPGPFIRNYTAVALVDSRGVVRELSVRYAIVSDDARTVVERSLSYGRIGEVAAGAPPWYINRFDDS